RGEVLARWQDFVGGGDLLRSLDDRVGRMRDRLLASVRGRPNRAEHVSEAITRGLQVLLQENAAAAAEQAERSWASGETGRALLRISAARLDRASGDVEARATRVVVQWQDNVLQMVRTEVSDRRMTSRYLAFGVNGLGVALMIVVLASGRSGSGPTNGPAQVAQSLLTSVFGEATVREMTQRAHGLLVTAASVMLDAEKSRFLELLARVETPSSVGE